jgi:NADPH-dependent curcumin reductase
MELRVQAGDGQNLAVEVLTEMFGISGMTAYFGMRECGPLMPGDAVAVAGATGSVG